MAGSSGTVCIRVLQYWYLSTGTLPSAYYDTTAPWIEIENLLGFYQFLFESSKGCLHNYCHTATLSLTMTCQCDLPCRVDSSTVDGHIIIQNYIVEQDMKIKHRTRIINTSNSKQQTQK